MRLRRPWRALTRARHALLGLSPEEHLPLIGGPADGLIVRAARPAPPWVYAALRPSPAGTVLLAAASDALAVYVTALGEEDAVARYHRFGDRYLHVVEAATPADGVPSPRPA